MRFCDTLLAITLLVCAGDAGYSGIPTSDQVFFLKTDDVPVQRVDAATGTVVENVLETWTLPTSLGKPTSLEVDESSCRMFVGFTSTFVDVNNRPSHIVTASFDGSAQEVFLTTTDSVLSFMLDKEERLLYWSQEDARIYRTSIDRGSSNYKVPSQLSTSDGGLGRYLERSIAVDTSTTPPTVYFADAFFSRIQRKQWGSTDKEELFYDWSSDDSFLAYKPRAMVVDPVGRYLYVCADGLSVPSIVRFSLNYTADGQYAIFNNISGSLQGMSAEALNSTANMLYWADTNGGTVGALVTTSTSSSAVWITSVGTPTAVATLSASVANANTCFTTTTTTTTTTLTSTTTTSITTSTTTTTTTSRTETASTTTSTSLTSSSTTTTGTTTATTTTTSRTETTLTTTSTSLTSTTTTGTTTATTTTTSRTETTSTTTTTSLTSSATTTSTTTTTTTSRTETTSTTTSTSLTSSSTTTTGTTSTTTTTATSVTATSTRTSTTISSTATTTTATRTTTTSVTTTLTSTSVTATETTTSATRTSTTTSTSTSSLTVTMVTITTTVGVTTATTTPTTTTTSSTTSSITSTSSTTTSTTSTTATLTTTTSATTTVTSTSATSTSTSATNTTTITPTVTYTTTTTTTFTGSSTSATTTTTTISTTTLTTSTTSSSITSSSTTSSSTTSSSTTSSSTTSSSTSATTTTATSTASTTTTTTSTSSASTTTTETSTRSSTTVTSSTSVTTTTTSATSTTTVTANPTNATLTGEVSFTASITANASTTEVQAVLADSILTWLGFTREQATVEVTSFSFVKVPGRRLQITTSSYWLATYKVVTNSPSVVTAFEQVTSTQKARTYDTLTSIVQDKLGAKSLASNVNVLALGVPTIVNLPVVPLACGATYCTGGLLYKAGVPAELCAAMICSQAQDSCCDPPFANAVGGDGSKKADGSLLAGVIAVCVLVPVLCLIAAFAGRYLCRKANGTDKRLLEYEKTTKFFPHHTEEDGEAVAVASGATLSPTLNAGQTKVTPLPAALDEVRTPRLGGGVTAPDLMPEEADGPGTYIVTSVSTVKRDLDLDSEEICKLPVGAVVQVAEVVDLGATHDRVRARLVDPPGWMSLRDTMGGFRWAVKQADTPSVRSALAPVTLTSPTGRRPSVLSDSAAPSGEAQVLLDSLPGEWRPCEDGLPTRRVVTIGANGYTLSDGARSPENDLRLQGNTIARGGGWLLKMDISSWRELYWTREGHQDVTWKRVKAAAEYRVGEPVLWLYDTKEVPKGTEGQVAAVKDHKLQVSFPKTTLELPANELMSVEDMRDDEMWDVLDQLQGEWRLYEGGTLFPGVVAIGPRGYTIYDGGHYPEQDLIIAGAVITRSDGWRVNMDVSNAKELVWTFPGQASITWKKVKAVSEYKPGDTVAWTMETHDVPKGSRGRVLAMTDHRVRVMFGRTVLDMLPSELLPVEAARGPPPPTLAAMAAEVHRQRQAAAAAQPSARPPSPKAAGAGALGLLPTLGKVTAHSGGGKAVVVSPTGAKDPSEHLAQLAAAGRLPTVEADNGQDRPAPKPKSAKDALASLAFEDSEQDSSAPAPRATPAVEPRRPPPLLSVMPEDGAADASASAAQTVAALARPGMELGAPAEAGAAGSSQRPPSTPEAAADAPLSPAGALASPTGAGAPGATAPAAPFGPQVDPKPSWWASNLFQAVAGPLGSKRLGSGPPGSVAASATSSGMPGIAEERPAAPRAQVPASLVGSPGAMRPIVSILTSEEGQPSPKSPRSPAHKSEMLGQPATEQASKISRGSADVIRDDGVVRDLDIVPIIDLDALPLRDEEPEDVRPSPVKKKNDGPRRQILV